MQKIAEVLHYYAGIRGPDMEQYFLLIVQILLCDGCFSC